MSIVALKRKTASQYNNVSVGQKQFSLNGTHRSQGFVGQTSLSRSLPRTLMRGNVAIGHGGNDGRYHQTGIITEGTGLGTNTLNDVHAVKASVLDTNGMLMSKYRWIRRPTPFTSVKPDTTLNINTQQQYVEILQRNTILSASNASHPGKVVMTNPQCCPHMKTNYKNYDATSRQKSIAKPNAVSTQGEHLLNKVSHECGIMDTCHKITKPHGNPPFACGV